MSSTKLLERLSEISRTSLQDSELIHQACIHKSLYGSQEIPKPNNERLEFLGDAVLDLVIGTFLMKRYPEADEGVLSKYRSSVVNTRVLSQAIRQLKLASFIKMSFGEERSGGRDKNSILANFFEALAGALYIAYGFKVAEKFILSGLKDELKKLTVKPFEEDYKSQLQEFCQKTFKQLPSYVLVKSSGPDHNKKFTVSVVLENGLESLGVANSKKQAEQICAQKMLGLLAEKSVEL